MNNILLTIAVPTFDRPQTLNDLLSQLRIAVERHSNINVVVSDNCSPPSTQLVLDKFSDVDRFIIVRNHSNIGALKNVLNICNYIDGEWFLLIGDDDNIDLSSLSRILKILLDLDRQTWILSNTYQPRVAKDRLKGLQQGSCSSISMFSFLIRNSLSRLGFLSAHIIPRKYASMLLSSTHSYGQWPHVFLFLTHLDSSSPFYVSKLPLVHKKPDGPKLSWQPSTWFRVNFDKVYLILSTLVTQRYKYFALLLLYREAFSLENVRNLVFWVSADFNSYLLTSSCILKPRPNHRFQVIFIFYYLVMLLFRYLPSFVPKLLLKITLQSGRYRRFKESSLDPSFDAESRGL